MTKVKSAADMAASYTAAWCAGPAEAVADHFTKDGEITINRGDPWLGREKIREMVAGSYADVPDLALTCDSFRVSGNHALFAWTFTGHDARTGNPLKVSGWEEWELDEDHKVVASCGWFDADDYARQVAGA